MARPGRPLQSPSAGRQSSCTRGHYWTSFSFSPARSTCAASRCGVPSVQVRPAAGPDPPAAHRARAEQRGLFAPHHAECTGSRLSWRPQSCVGSPGDTSEDNRCSRHSGRVRLCAAEPQAASARLGRAGTTEQRHGVATKLSLCGFGVFEPGAKACNSSQHELCPPLCPKARFYRVIAP